MSHDVLADANDDLALWEGVRERMTSPARCEELSRFARAWVRVGRPLASVLLKQIEAQAKVSGVGEKKKALRRPRFVV